MSRLTLVSISTSVSVGLAVYNYRKARDYNRALYWTPRNRRDYKLLTSNTYSPLYYLQRDEFRRMALLHPRNVDNVPVEYLDGLGQLLIEDDMQHYPFVGDKMFTALNYPSKQEVRKELVSAITPEVLRKYPDLCVVMREDEITIEMINVLIDITDKINKGTIAKDDRRWKYCYYYDRVMPLTKSNELYEYVCERGLEDFFDRIKPE